MFFMGNLARAKLMVKAPCIGRSCPSRIAHREKVILRGSLLICSVAARNAPGQWRDRSKRPLFLHPRG